MLNKVGRFAREILNEPAHRIPARIAAIARTKFVIGSERALEALHAHSLFSAVYGGKGVAVMFHEIHSDVDGQLRTGCGLDQLRDTILAIKASGREIVSADEALRRLGDPGSAKFAVLTFDDGYRDNMTRALPLLEEFSAPMTMFVPTGMVTRELYAWWLGLRELLKSRDSVDIEPMETHIDCPDIEAKCRAMRQVTAWIGTDQSRADALRPTFDRYGLSLSDLIADVALGENELKTLAAHPLVTIGGHTTSHRFLSDLSDDAALADIRDNKLFLEGLLGAPVDHFAYPYGTAGACGPREFGYVRTAGYKTGYTTRPGHLFPAHLQNPHAMPREDLGFAPQTTAQRASRLSGARRAIVTGFGNRVAGQS